MSFLLCFLSFLQAATIIFGENFDTKRALFTVELDQRKISEKRRSFETNRAYNLSFIKFVSLSQNNDETVNFSFHSDKGPYISITDIDPKVFLPRKLNLENNCLETLQAYFDEYARKAILITRKPSPDDSLAQTILKNKFFAQYPMDHFVITNNCRSLGSFEFEWPGLLKGHFQFPQEIIRKIFKVPNGHSEYRLTKWYYNQFKDEISLSYSPKDLISFLYSKFFDEYYQWISLGDFSVVQKICSPEEINKFVHQTQSHSRAFTVDDEEIPYLEFPMETRVKGGWSRSSESLAYVKTPCGKNNTPSPWAFVLPLTDRPSTFDEMWSSGPCLILPHKYQSFEDISKYEVHLSQFEVDGIYTGKSLAKDHAPLLEDDKKLWKDEKVRQAFDFHYLQNVSSIWYGEDSTLSNITVKFENGLQLKIQNIDVKKLRQKSFHPTFQSFFNDRMSDSRKGLFFLLGIAPRPLADSYESAISKGPIALPLMAFFTDKAGVVQDHHRPNIGVEAINLKLIQEGEISQMVVDLLSHERILPVARYRVSLNKTNPSN